jgi:hypothetical protein
MRSFSVYALSLSDGFIHYGLAEWVGHGDWRKGYFKKLIMIVLRWKLF